MKNAHYIIRFKGLNCGSIMYGASNYSGRGLGGGTLHRELARKFSTVSQALHAINENGALRGESHMKVAGSLNAEIVKITETPGTSTIRITNTRVVDLSKPVVLYETDACVFVGADGWAVENVQNAEVFSDGSAALDALVQYSALPGWIQDVTHLVNVEHTIAVPTITEEVLG
jgi:hypothetical protein